MSNTFDWRGGEESMKISVESDTNTSGGGSREVKSSCDWCREVKSRQICVDPNAITKE